MKRFMVLSALMTLGLTGRGAEESFLSRTRPALEQWVETRQLISKTRSDWQVDKETIEQTTQLFERELASIAEQMSTVSTNSSQAGKEREAALAEQNELNEALERVKTLAGELEVKLLELAPTFPPPLAERVQPLLKRVPSDPAATKMSGLERLQNAVGIINEADKFNAAVTVVAEVRKNPSGAEVQVETIYIGLAQAYFVDKAGEYAGVGMPGKQGWHWTAENKLADRIKKSIAMYKNTTPAAFVSLPVRIQ